MSRADVVGDQPLHGFGGARAAKVDLAHVADVEYPDGLPGGAVLVDDAAGVADWHRPAAEVDHLRAEAEVGFVERGALHGGDILEERSREFKPAVSA